jgi:hypothetical protein
LHDKPLSYSAAYAGFKDLLRLGGLDPDSYSLHSPRAGGTTDAFNAGVPLHIIDIKGRWRCPASKFVYARPSDAVIVEESGVGPKYH